MKTGYFFDTYAIVEILKNNPNYIKFKNEPVITSTFNLAELYYSVLRDFNEEKANKVLDLYKNSVADIDDKTLRQAMKFKLKHRKRHISYADAIGYIYAKNHNMKFLTGDKEFLDIENVEFVK